MTTTLAPTTNQPQHLTHVDHDRMAAFSARAGAALRSSKFKEFRELKAARTVRSHDTDLMLFSTALADAGIIDEAHVQAHADALAAGPGAWSGVNHDIVAAFKLWMLAKGYALGSVDHALASVRTYSRLAYESTDQAAYTAAVDAGRRPVGLSVDDFAGIRMVRGYNGRESLRKDSARAADGFATRRGKKRTAAEMHNNPPTAAELRKLKNYPDRKTPQGRRDAVIMTLLVELGMRVSELEQMVINGMVDLGDGDVRQVGVDMESGIISFYCEKTNVVVSWRQPPDVAAVLKLWLSTDAPAMGPLLRSSLKGGTLTDAGMTRGAISARVREISKAAIGRELSPHDIRHGTITVYVQRYPDRLHDLSLMFGWKLGSKMIYTYAKERDVANDDGLVGSI